MDTILHVISLVGTVLTGAMTILMVFTFRKARRIGLLSPLTSMAVSLVMLPLFILLSGARLNWLVGVPVLAVGLVVGFLRGLTTRLYHDERGQVVGRNSVLFLVGWGGSLALAQLVNTLGSALLASVGLIPMFLTTGTQVGMNANIAIRRLMMRHPAARTPVGLPERSKPASLGLPERHG